VIKKLVSVALPVASIVVGGVLAPAHAGDFQVWSSSPHGKVLVGDFNHDGRADFAITGPAGWSTLPVAFSVACWGSPYNVTNLPLGGFPGWASSAGAQPIAADFDGDGKADIAITGPSGWSSMPVAFSNGDGSFRVTNAGLSLFPAWASSPGARALAGDFDGDGDADVAITGPSGWTSLPVAFSNRDGTFRVANFTLADFPSWASSFSAQALTGDFNGDGKADVALTGPSAWWSLPVAFSNGDGTFRVTNRQLASFPTWAASANVQAVVGDFNADGKADVALTGPSNWTTLPVAFSNGDGTFRVTNASLATFPQMAAAPGSQAVVGDFDHDGDADIALAGVTGSPAFPIALSNGDGTFRVANDASVWNPPASPGRCRDPWVTDTVTTLLCRPPQGDGDSGECNYQLYGHGSWNGYDDLYAKVLRTYACHDPWVSRAIVEATGRPANGLGDAGECNVRLYNGGQWASYAQLLSAVQAVESQPPASKMGRCRDTWITQAYNSLYQRAPGGYDEQGECNMYLYGGGQWDSPQALENDVQQYQTVAGANGHITIVQGNLADGHNSRNVFGVPPSSLTELCSRGVLSAGLSPVAGIVTNGSGGIITNAGAGLSGNVGAGVSNTALAFIPTTTLSSSAMQIITTAGGGIITNASGNIHGIITNAGAGTTPPAPAAPASPIYKSNLNLLLSVPPAF
jgi:hypothetical protein